MRTGLEPALLGGHSRSARGRSCSAVAPASRCSGVVLGCDGSRRIWSAACQRSYSKPSRPRGPVGHLMWLSERVSDALGSIQLRFPDRSDQRLFNQLFRDLDAVPLVVLRIVDVSTLALEPLLQQQQHLGAELGGATL